MYVTVFAQGGDVQGRRGYWGDIVSSPYLSFGLETDDKDLLRTGEKDKVRRGPPSLRMYGLVHGYMFHTYLTKLIHMCVTSGCYGAV